MNIIVNNILTSYMTLSLCTIIALPLIILKYIAYVGKFDMFFRLSKPLRFVAQKTNSASQEELEMRVYSFSSGVQNVSNSEFGRRRQRRIRPTRLRTLIQSILNNLFHIFRKK